MYLEEYLSEWRHDKYANVHPREGKLFHQLKYLVHFLVQYVH